MVSVNTSPNAFVLANLRQINSDLTAAQNRISSGLKISSAKDNASVWATSEGLKTEVARNQAVLDSLATPKAIADAASSGLDGIAGALSDITKLVALMSAAGAATDAQKAQLTALQSKVTASVNASSYASVNLLTSATDVKATTYFNADGTLGQATYTSNVILSDADVSAVMAASPDLSDATKISTYAGKVANAQSKIAIAAAKVAGFSANLDLATTLNTKGIDIRQTAIGAMLNTDMEKESVLVQALQVRQQLAYQALSIAPNAQSILRLFQ